MRVHSPVESIEVVTKCPVDDLISAEYPARFPHEHRQQPGFSRREAHLFGANVYLRVDSQ